MTVSAQSFGDMHVFYGIKLRRLINISQRTENKKAHISIKKYSYRSSQNYFKNAKYQVNFTRSHFKAI